MKIIRPSPSKTTLINATKNDQLADLCFLQFSRAPFNQTSSTIFLKENVVATTTFYLLELSFDNYSQKDG